MFFQSCLKALEYLGFIREKEQKWVEAAANYEKAWKLSKKRNPTIGKGIQKINRTLKSFFCHVYFVYRLQISIQLFKI